MDRLLELATPIPDEGVDLDRFVVQSPAHAAVFGLSAPVAAALYRRFCLPMPIPAWLLGVSPSKRALADVALRRRLVDRYGARVMPIGWLTRRIHASSTEGG